MSRSATAEYRFLRVQAGIPSFAKVIVSAEPADAWEVRLGDPSETFQRAFSGALDAGVTRAIRVHESRGAAPHRLTVVALLGTYVDTSENAVECASAMAAWRVLGGAEADAIVEFADGRWTVTLPQT